MSKNLVLLFLLLATIGGVSRLRSATEPQGREQDALHLCIRGYSSVLQVWETPTGGHYLLAEDGHRGYCGTSGWDGVKIPLPDGRSIPLDVSRIHVRLPIDGHLSQAEMTRLSISLKRLQNGEASKQLPQRQAAAFTWRLSDGTRTRTLVDYPHVYLARIVLNIEINAAQRAFMEAIRSQCQEAGIEPPSADQADESVIPTELP